MPYLAFLSLSRTALITSAHHLQSPQNSLNLDLLESHGISVSCFILRMEQGSTYATLVALLLLQRLVTGGGGRGLLKRVGQVSF
jgi:hypothetical protein